MPLLEVPEPFAFDPDLANLWVDGALHRVVGAREVRVEPARGGVRVEPLDDETRPVVGKLLGLEFDLAGFYEWAQRDPVLKELTTRLAAFAIRDRLIERFGRRVGQAYAFPTAERLRRAEPDELFALGFSRRKAEYVLGVADEPVDLDELASLPDDEVKRRLVAVRGIGKWTAEWFLARHLARPRAWPVGDVALDKAVRAFYPEALDIRAFGERFDPFQNLTAHYLLTGARLAP